MKKIKVFIDIDDTLAEYKRAHDIALEKNPEIKYPQSQYGFFRNLTLKPYALETFLALRRSEIYDPWILTRPSIKNRMSYLEKADWIVQYFGEEQLDKTIYACHKGMIRGKNAILIDDKSWPKFKGQHIHFGTEKFPDWATVNDYLFEKFDRI